MLKYPIEVGEHMIQYTYDLLLLNRTPETYLILVTDVALIILIQNFNNKKNIPLRLSIVTFSSYLCKFLFYVFRCYVASLRFMYPCGGFFFYYYVVSFHF